MGKHQAALLSIFSNSILIIFKLIAGIFMGSISVISEALHSGIDLLASIIAFFSIREASKVPDDEHPFGHGKYENVSGFVEAILIFLAAILIIFEAVKKILHGATIENTGAGILVMLVATLANFIISMLLLKIAKKTDSIALEADGMHLLTDVFTSMGVLVGLVLVRFTGLKIIDPIAALLVAILIIKTSIDMTKKSIVDLVDSKLPEEEVNRIVDIISTYPQVKTYHKLRTRKSGQRREVDIHLKLDDSTSLTEAHSLCNAVEQDIKALFPECYVLIHIEPYNNLNYSEV
ncbi:cation diffusion facilitator family transporter [Clostridium omnivorum]|uniref:Cation efflux system protein n=1 Tax=Clostridium omnivorum TaxID=1604902 RepID=A0ABQ5N5M6_9CLOT|nr:cation diffusion facilitator family transporter [Clostridium sp. E14]GLC30440.1 cation efflux system protein [Clostridium sp. E14]